jgi:excisionase family DNA binding protein
MSGKDLRKLGISIREAVKITGLGRTTLWKAVRSGRLQCYRIGRRTLFSAKHLQDFLHAHEAPISRPRRTRTSREF